MSLFRYSSQDFSDGSIETFQDYFSEIVRMDYRPLAENNDSQCLNVSLRVLPGAAVSLSSVFPCKAMRTSAQVADGDDDLVLVFPLNIGGTLAQCGKEEYCRPGEAYLWFNDEPGIGVCPGQLTALNIAVARAGVAPAVADLSQRWKNRVIPVATPGLRLLGCYARMLTGDVGPMSLEERSLAAAHIQDLVAVVLGATREAEEIAKGRGVRAARLAAIKADIVAHITQTDLSAEVMGTRHCISPQYVRALFRSEGTTFSDFVLTHRLARVHRRLSDPRFGTCVISALAFEAGFGDLSWFNQAFRRRYGITPTEVKEASLERNKSPLLQSTDVHVPEEGQ